MCVPVTERRKERALKEEDFDVPDEMPELVDQSGDKEPAKPHRRRGRRAVCESGGSRIEPRHPRVGLGKRSKDVTPRDK